MSERRAQITRKTRETDITIALALDGKGEGEIETGIGFFDHMLTAFKVHGGFDLSVRAAGDLVVDGHHTVEDVGIVLGKAFSEALGEKKGIARFGSAFVPMDEALGFAAVDLSGRPYLVFDAKIGEPMVGDFDCGLAEEFFRSFSMNAGVTLHLRAEYGKNAHHIIEALFKAGARAMKEAVRQTGTGEVLSTKGVL